MSMTLAEQMAADEGKAVMPMCSYKFSSNRADDWHHCARRAVGYLVPERKEKPLCDLHLPSTHAVLDAKGVPA